MTREEAIEFIAQSVKSDVDMALIADAIKVLEQEPRWIPCSEKLPEYGEEVLTCSNGGFIEIQSLENRCDGYWENQKGDWSDLDEIVAWMPLPLPWEGESEE